MIILGARSCSILFGAALMVASLVTGPGPAVAVEVGEGFPHLAADGVLDADEEDAFLGGHGGLFGG